MDYVELALCFGIVRRRSQALIVEACRDLGLNYSEYALLLKLNHMEGCSQDELASVLYVDKAAITRVIKGLEAKGYLYREVDSIDRRLRRLYLTEFGHQQEIVIEDIVNQLMGQLAAGFNPNRLHHLTEGFKELSDMMRRDDFEIVLPDREGRNNEK